MLGTPRIGQRGLVGPFGAAAQPAPVGRAKFRAMSNGLFSAATILAFIKKAIDLDDAGVDRCVPCLEFHIGDHGLTAFCPWIDFPVPP